MSGLFIAIGVGVIVASAVAFAATIFAPDPAETATEDRLAAMASRRRGGTVGRTASRSASAASRQMVSGRGRGSRPREMRPAGGAGLRVSAGVYCRPYWCASGDAGGRSPFSACGRAGSEGFPARPDRRRPLSRRPGGLRWTTSAPASRPPARRGTPAHRRRRRG